MGLKQPGDRLGGDQRHVAGEHQHGLGFLDQRQRRPHGAAGAVGLGLDDGLDLVGQPRDDVWLRRDDRHDHRPRAASRAASIGQATISRPQTG